MYTKLVGGLLLLCCGFVTPQQVSKSAVRQTRQVLPVGAYPGGGTYGYPTAYPAAYPAAYPTAYPGAYPTPGYGPGPAVYRRRPTPGPVGGSEAGAAIVSQVQDVGFDGNFNFAYQTENGISAQVTGQPTNPGTEVQGQAMQGSFSYTSPEGIPITVNWYADEGGFHAEGEHLPRQPIVPVGPEVPYAYPGSLGRPLSRPVPTLAP